MPAVLAVLALLLVGAAGAVEAPPAAPAAATAANAPDYRLFPGDLLRIEVFDNPDLSSQLRVPATGSSSFPLIGDIGVLAGRPLAEFGSELRTRLESRYLRQAIVTITVVEFGQRFAYVMGSVREPDAIALDPLRTITAMQAVAQAGGFLDDADRAGAQVLRDDPAAPGGKIALPVPAGDAAGDLARDIALAPGDVIIVPRLDRVYVIGKVQKPGALNLPSREQLTVSKAISLSGGFDKFARQDAVQLVRSGVVTTVDVRALLSGDKVADPVLRPGDTVYVQETRF